MSNSVVTNVLKLLLAKAENAEAASQALPPNAGKGGAAHALDLAIASLQSLRSKVENGQMPDTVPIEIKRTFETLMTSLGLPAAGGVQMTAQKSESMTPERFGAYITEQVTALATDTADVQKARYAHIEKAVAIAKAELSWTNPGNSPKPINIEVFEVFPGAAGSAAGAPKSEDLTVSKEQSTKDQQVQSPPSASQDSAFAENVMQAVGKAMSALASVMTDQGKPGTPSAVQKSDDFKWPSDMNAKAETPDTDEKAPLRKRHAASDTGWGHDPWKAKNELF